MSDNAKITDPDESAEEINRGGRPSFEPVKAHRDLVSLLCGLGFPEDDVAKLVVNPQTGRGIDSKTLRKCFREELDTGHLKTHALIGKFIVGSITGQDGGVPGSIVSDDGARSRLAIFYAKTQMRWKETVVNENVGKDGGPIEYVDSARARLIGAIDRLAASLEETATDPPDDGEGR